MKGSVGFIGGDLRQLAMLDRFSEDGYSVKIFGNNVSDCNCDNIEDIYKCDIIIFPVPSFSGDCVVAPFSDEKIYINDLNLPHGRKIFYAGGNTAFLNKIKESGCVGINYFESEELVLKNAVLTAEGALETVIAETAHSVFKSDVLIYGYGKVAKALARVLKAVGANVTVAVRRSGALAEIWSDGYEGIYIDETNGILCEFDVIFNTVPAKILDREKLSCVNKSSLVIDLASKPGGVDFDEAKKMGLKIIWALSIPGKTAPITAGNIIYETISDILREGDEKYA